MNRPMAILMGALFVLGLCVAPVWANTASGAVGSVVAVRGEVLAANGKQGERPLGMKSEIFQADVIRTGANGRVQLLFADETIISLGNNTVMEVARYEWDAAKKTGTMKTRIEEGTFRVLGGMITKTSPKNFSTETPAATIGIRGSMYAGSYRLKQLQVAFLGGRGIFVTNPQGRVDIDLPGYGTRVLPGQAPEPPVKMNGQELLGMIEDSRNENLAQGGSEISPENAEILDPGTGGSVDTSALEPVVVIAQNVEVTQGDAAAMSELLDELDRDVERPVAVPDGYTTGEDVPLVVEVAALLENDTDSFWGTPSFVGIANHPLNGTLAEDEDGAYVYRPNADYNGSDVFSYEVTYSDGTISSATVSIDVSGVNDLPLAQNADYSVNEDASLAGALVFSDVDGDALVVALTSGQAENGLVTVNPDGTFSYTPVANFSGTDSFLYTVTDSHGASSTGTVSIDVSPVADVAAMSGWSQSFLRAVDETSPRAPRDAVTATSVDGYVSDGTGLQPFTMEVYNPGGTYASPVYSADSTLINTTVGTLPGMRYILWDDKGEFFLYGQRADLIDNIDSYQSLAFAGLPANTLPVDGVDHYSGYGIGGGIDPVVPEQLVSGPAVTDMWINWGNNKLFGIIYDSEDLGGAENPYSPRVYFFGDISSGPSDTFVTEGPGEVSPPIGYLYSDANPAPSNVRFASAYNWSSTGPGLAKTKTGIVDFSQFYGSEYQGFGLTAHGIDYDLATMTAIENWQGIFGLFREPGATVTSQTGTKSWNGYFVGVWGGQTYSSVVQNDLSSDFSLILDPVTGTAQGSLALPWIEPIPLGGPGSSAYVDLAGNPQFIAEFTPGFYSGDGSVDVTLPGSFLVTADPAHQFSDYVSWGYWNLVNADTSQIINPGSFWVAGEKTPAAGVSTLIATNVTGTYTGPAYGVRIDSDTSSPTYGAITPLTGGDTNLTFDFGASNVYGAITFVEKNLYVDGGVTLDPAGNFNVNNAIYSNTGYINHSQINGGFFGLGAEAMGGTFSASATDGQFSGIIGGNVGGTPVVPPQW